MNVSLTPEFEEFIQDRVRSGRYHSASEVVREALRLLEDQDEVRRLRLDEIRKRIAAGLASLEKGQGIPGDEAFDELESGLATPSQKSI